MKPHTLHHGDCLDVLRELESESVDALVCDPPSGIAFMNAKWDRDKGGRDQWIAWLAEIMREALRVLKPGAHALVWALPRTSHWTATAVEDVGFEIRDIVMHLFGSGFPKNHDISKAIDRAKGAEREVVGVKYEGSGNGSTKGVYGDMSADHSGVNITAPATPEASQWSGFGTALKPSYENWILARKPITTTIAANVLKHGTGGLNIEACRVGSEALPEVRAGQAKIGTLKRADMVTPSRLGRWPAHLVLSHHPDCSGTCVEGCPVRVLGEQSGESGSKERVGARSAKRSGVLGIFAGQQSAMKDHADTGTAARFFYVSKPSPRERDAGLSSAPKTTNDGRNTPIDNAYQRGETERKNHHPTVKPIQLMRYLCRLVTPPGGTIIDPFTGSGTTGIAALLEGFNFIGIEQSADFIEIARQRIEWVAEHGEKWLERSGAEPVKDERQMGLF